MTAHDTKQQTYTLRRYMVEARRAATELLEVTQDFRREVEGAIDRSEVRELPTAIERYVAKVEPLTGKVEAIADDVDRLFPPGEQGNGGESDKEEILQILRELSVAQLSALSHARHELHFVVGMLANLLKSEQGSEAAWTLVFDTASDFDAATRQLRLVRNRLAYHPPAGRAAGECEECNEKKAVMRSHGSTLTGE